MERHLSVSKAWKERSGEKANCGALKNAWVQSSGGSSTLDSSLAMGFSLTPGFSSAVEIFFETVIHV